MQPHTGYGKSAAVMAAVLATSTMTTQRSRREITTVLGAPRSGKNHATMTHPGMDYLNATGRLGRSHPVPGPLIPTVRGPLIVTDEISLAGTDRLHPSTARKGHLS